MFRLGVHVSIAGSIDQSAERAYKLGCNTMQIFSRNPRQWRKSSLSDEEASLFRETVHKYRIDPVVIHIPYILNLASSKQPFYKITIREFIIDLKEAGRLAAQYLITHIGSYKGGNERGGLLRVINALKKILKETKDSKTIVLLENTSGSGHWLGGSFSHHRFILEELDWSQRLGVCLDTAHAWAAGYKINDASGVDSLLDEIDKKVSLKRLKVIHLNDTQEELGSRRDRHADIGSGNIGSRGFRALLNHPALAQVAFILETPKHSDSDDQRNLKAVRRLVDK